jgi:murein L,D-transpeptidase YafK
MAAFWQIALPAPHLMDNDVSMTAARGVSRLNGRTLRTLMASAAMAAAIGLAGCDTKDIPTTGRSQAPLSPKMLSLMEEKRMDKEAPILARIFKEEAEMEVWKRNRDGQFELLKTYPICRWSGDLGPKKREGDRQAPEGFYAIGPRQMNPASNYYLAFNTGFPNAYDRAMGYSGSELMIHGDCSSRGCYAMTDEQIQEIYALARESFFGGQSSFQLQAYPFRMTALNMAKHRNNPNFAFWKMLKEGYDDFDATHQEPKVAVCDRHYVFDAAAPDGSTKPLKFDARAKCPAYQLDPSIADIVNQKRQSEQTQLASYIHQNVSTVALHTGTDGGSNQVFASQFAAYETSGNYSRSYQLASMPQAPGYLPRTKEQMTPPPAAETPQAPAQQVADTTPVVTERVRLPEAAPLPKEGEAPVEQPKTMNSLLANIFNPPQAQQPTAPAVTEPEQPATLRGSEQPAKKLQHPAIVRTASAPVPALPKLHHQPTPAPKSVANNAPTSAPASPAAVNWPAAPDPLQQAKAEPKPEKQPELRTAYSAPPPSNGFISGSQPAMPAGSFEARWSGLR